jgi:ATP-binding cassette subfamily F protein 3
MLNFDNLSMAYNGRFLFSQAFFTIQKGERLGLVGRNGSGKSTLFKLITKEETPDSGSITSKKNYSIGILNQHLRFTEKSLLVEAARGLKFGEEDCLYKVETILFGLGFKEEDLNKPIDSFSGGYQLRLHLAKVLVSEPDCLLLDEPTNYLDIVSIRWLTHFLKKWPGEFILISHDREFMDSVTTHTIGIHRKKIKKFKGGTTNFYEQIFQEEEIHEKTWINQEKKRAHFQSFVDRFGAKANKAAQAQTRVKMIARIPILEKLKELHKLDFTFKEAPFYGKKMLDVHEVDFSYTNHEPLIQNLSLSIEKKQRVGIIGKNGRGKSTILRLLWGELTATRGSFKCSDNLAIGYFGQTNIDRLHMKHTVEEEIANANTALTRTEVKSIAGLMMFEDDQASKKIEVLSGGEKSRVLLGKILAKPCNLLLLDEPTHHLDMESIEALIDALENFEGTVIIATHSELILKRLTLDKIIICHKGQQNLFLGRYEEFLESNSWHD